MQWRTGMFRQVAAILFLALLCVTTSGAQRSFAQVDGKAGNRAVAATVASVVRLAGADRYETAAAVSKHGWTSSAYVIIATGQNFPDALAGAPLAKAYNAPILLTAVGSLPPSTANEIRRLHATHAIILGGTPSVSTTVQNKLKSIVGSSHVERIAGTNRYDTALLIALRVKSKAGFGGKVVVATGSSFPDALAVAGFAAQMRYPILLAQSNALPSQTKTAIAQLVPSASIVVGKTSAISNAVMGLLPNPIRLAGTDDYGTAHEVAEYAATHGSSFAQVVITSSYGFADALSGGGLTSKIGGVFLLTTPSVLCNAACESLRGHLNEISSVHILGGEVSFHAGTKDALDALLAEINGVPWSARRVISAPTGNYYVRDIDAKVGPDGGLNVVWFDGDHLYLRKLDAKGNTVISPVVVPGDDVRELGGYGESYTRIAVGPDGRITVLWRHHSGNVNKDGVWAVQYDSAGHFIQGPRRLDIVEARFLDASTDASGDIHITGRSASFQPEYSRLSADLQVRVPWEGLSSISRLYVTREEAIAVRPSGIAEIMWYDARDYATYGHYQLYHTRLAWVPGGIAPPGGGSINQAKITSATGGFYEAEAGDSNFSGNSWQPGTSVGADGSVHLGWIDDGSAIYYERLGASGAVETSATKLVAITSSPDFTPQVDVAANTGGGADVVFPYSTTDGVRLGHIRVASNGTSQTPTSRIGALTSRPRQFALQRNDANLQLAYIESNGSFQRVYYVDTLRDATSFDTSRCDLVVDDAHSSNSAWPKEGQVVTMTVLVANHGWVASPPTKAVFSYLGARFATVTVPALAVDATTSVSATWTVPVSFSVAEPSMDVSVDPTNTVAETSESNNTVQHVVPVHLRPADMALAFVGFDETNDSDHTLGYYQTDHIRASLTGTRSEAPFGSLSQTIDMTATSAPGLFRHIPPGTYLLSYVCTDYAAPYSPIPVTVTRDIADPYSLTASPNAGYIECWVNTWGTLGGKAWNDNGTPGTGDDTALSGAKVTIVEDGRTTTTASDGTFSFAHVAAGGWHLSLEKDNFLRLRSVATTVTIGGNPNVQMRTSPTTKADVEVQVTSVDGAPMAGATVEIRDSSENVLLTATADDAGNAHFEPEAGSSIHVRASMPFYNPDSTSAFTPVAGRSYFKMLSPSLDPAQLSRTSSNWTTWAIYTDYFRFANDESTTSYRNFQSHFNVDWVDDSGVRKIKAIHAWAHGLQFMINDMKVPVEWEIFGYPLKLFDAEPTFKTYDQSNVWIKHVELIDSSDGSVIWNSGDITPLVRTGDYGDGMAAAHLNLDQPVNWSDLEVWTWYTVEKVDVAGEWEPSPLGGYGSNSMTVIFKPSTNTQRAEMRPFDP